MDVYKKTIVDAFKSGNLNANARTITELRDNNFALATMPRRLYTAAARSLIDSAAIVQKKGRFELSPTLENNKVVEIVSNDFDVDKLANYARLTTGRDASFDRDKNRRLCVTLMKSKHLTPFEFFSVVVRFRVPLFVARQLMRYRCGTYLEKSLRRTPPAKIKNPKSATSKYYNSCVDLYNAKVKAGEPREIARAVLPMVTPTEFLCRWDYRELCHIFDERISKDTQAETRAVVYLLYEKLSRLDPDFIDAYTAARCKGTQNATQ